MSESTHTHTQHTPYSHSTLEPLCSLAKHQQFTLQINMVCECGCVNKEGPQQLLSVGWPESRKCVSITSGYPWQRP